MNKIIFFDIDNTIFDTKKFLTEFYSLLVSNFSLSDENVMQISSYYSEVKDEFGYFSYQSFLTKIYLNFPNLSGKLDYYFKSENIEKFLFSDSDALFRIEGFRIGIFSMGDLEFQRTKVAKFESILEEDLIYIFHEKLDKLIQVTEGHKDSQLFFVDDHIDVLLSAKALNPSVRTILIDREGEFHSAGIDFKISSLFDIIPILNE